MHTLSTNNRQIFKGVIFRSKPQFSNKVGMLKNGNFHRKFYISRYKIQAGEEFFLSNRSGQIKKARVFHCQRFHRGKASSPLSIMFPLFYNVNRIDHPLALQSDSH